MLGLATGTELRLAFYGILLAAISGWLIYERGHLIDEGEARIKAQDTKARAEQKAKDDQVNAGVINELNSKLAALPPIVSPPHLRLCIPTSLVRTIPAPSGTEPPVAATSGEGAGGVPSGVTQLDIGEDVQNLKRAAQVSAIYRDELWDWAVKSTR